MTEAIIVDDVRKTYPRGWNNPSREALRGVSMVVGQGETFGFIGPNGAGKSTLIKILVGILRPTQGSARLFGIDVGTHDARKGLGFVPENPSLQDFLTPLEIALMGLRLHGVRVDDARKHCMAWIERFDLGKFANTPVRGFSKGMLQRAALAQAMAIRPRLLILDEPLSGLDPVGRREVVEILDRYCRDGGTLFFSSHVLHDVERLADRFGLIHQGNLLAVQSPNDLVADEQFVTVRTHGVTELPGFRREAGSRWMVEVPRGQLWETLRQVEAAGHGLIEVKPTLTLESAFFRYLGSQSHDVSSDGRHRPVAAGDR